VQGWNTYENELNIQVIPIGEEELHEPFFGCGCCPFQTKDIITDKIVIVHSSYDGREIYEECEGTPFHRVRQKYDC
jgi:hypothetical protein